MSIFERIVSTLSSDTDECRAVVSNKNWATQAGSSVTTCGNDAWGSGHVDGHDVKYCEQHTPSDATAWNSGRVESVEFYIPDSELIIEVD